MPRMQPESRLDDLYIIGLDFDGHQWVAPAGVIKIGRSGDATERLIDGIQPCCPFRLKILYVERHAGRYEHLLHREFQLHRLHGEWFQLDTADPVSAVLDALALIRVRVQAAEQQQATQERQKIRRLLAQVGAD